MGKRDMFIDPEATRDASSRRVTARDAASFGHVESGRGYKPEQGLRERREARRNAPKAPLTPRRKAGIAVVLLLAAALLVVAWCHRPVEITVNGSRRTYGAGTSLGDIRHEEGIESEAGDLVSVSGAVLEEGAGDPWSAQVNDEELSCADATPYAISGGERIVFGDGADVTEDYDTEVVDVRPKLVMEGGPGAVTFVSQWGRVGSKEVLTGKVSGESVDGGTVKEARDCVLTTKNVESAGGAKLVALTFDDGPSQYTERYLQILEEHDAVATFFSLGECADQYLTTLSADKTLSEITSAFEAIEKGSGSVTTVIRPPYGAVNSDVWLATAGTVSVSVLWNMDSLDWSLPGADAIVSNCTSGIQSGYVILMHDGGGNRDQDLETLPRIIDALHEQGYEFVTISELMASDESIPESVASCSTAMPDDATWPTEAS